MVGKGLLITLGIMVWFPVFEAVNVLCALNPVDCSKLLLGLM